MSSDFRDTFFDVRSEQNFSDLLEIIRSEKVVGVLGAGASKSSGLPTWNELSKRLLDEARTISEPSNMPFVRQFTLARNTLGADATLALMKELFDRPVTALPAVYELSGEIFSPLITTNYDNFLSVLAYKLESAPEIQIYPALRWGRRFYYLHGHAYSARTIRNLVLCDDDYRDAYELELAPAKITLANALSEVACVFVGCSFEDPGFDLVSKLLNSTRLRYQDLGGYGEEIYTPVPNWFILLPAPSLTEFDLGALNDYPRESQDEVRREIKLSLVSRSSREFANNGLRPIWYRRDPDHEALLTLLRRLEEERRAAVEQIRRPVFLDQAERLEALGKRPFPSRQEEIELIRMLRNIPGASLHFFKHASSGAWFDILDRAGFIRTFSNPIEDPKGTFTIGVWDAAPYIPIVAQQAKTAFLDFVSQIETDNWNVVRVLSHNFSKMAISDIRSKINEFYGRWLQGRFVELSGLHYQCIEFIRRLSDEDETVAALDLLRVWFSSLDNDASEVDAGVLRIGSEELTSVIGKLSAKAPEETFLLIRSILGGFLAKDSDYPAVWSIRRPAVEEHVQNWDQGKVVGTLISCLRDSALSIANSGIEKRRELLRELLTDEHPLIRRIGLSATWKSESLETLELLNDQALLNTFLFDSATFHEMALILRDRFGDFDPKVRDNLMRHLADGARVTSDSDTEHRHDLWRWRYLSLIPEASLPLDLQRNKVELDERYGHNDEPTFVNYVRVSAPKSPVTPDELWQILSNRGEEALLSAIRNPPQLIEPSWESRSELAWSSLRSLITEDPKFLLSLAAHIAPGDFANDAAGAYLDTYEELARSGQAFPWSPLLALIERLIAHAKSDKKSVSEYWVTCAARLLDHASYSKNSASEAELLRILGMLQQIVQIYGTRLTNPDAISRDLHMHQLNSPAGAAADALLTLLFRCSVLPASSRFRSDIQPALLEYLTDPLLGKTPIQETVLAASKSLPILEAVQPGITAASIRSLLEETDKELCNNRSRWFWTGVFASHQLTNPVLFGLEAGYRSLIAKIEGPEAGDSWLDGESIERLGEQIVIGWARRLDPFASGELLETFASSVTDRHRGHLNWYIGKYLELAQSFEEKDQTQLWQQVRTYWDHRISESNVYTKGNSEPASYEANSVAFWFQFVDVDPSEIHQQLRATISKVRHGFALEQITEYLNRHIDRDQNIALGILEALVNRCVSEPELYWRGGKLREAFSALAGRVDAIGESKLKEMVGHLLRTQTADFRDLLASDR